MASLKEKAINYKGKDLQDLQSIPIDIEIKEGLNEKTGRKFDYIEIEGWKYWVPADILKQLQYLLQQDPSIKAFKVNKAPNGNLYVIKA